MKGTLADRFWDKVARPDNEEPCWLWIGSKDKFGYGYITSGGRHGKNLGAHRVAYELAFGMIPANMCVLHACDVPACVNPNHLFLGSRIDNNLDRDAKGRGRPNGLRGSRHPRAKISEKDIPIIHARAWAGEPRSQIARCYGISKAQVGSIKHGRTWKHVERWKYWRCFHCDEVFTTEEAAREHFGEDPGEPTACLRGRQGPAEFSTEGESDGDE
jgi:hypothetical protein